MKTLHKQLTREVSHMFLVSAILLSSQGIGVSPESALFFQNAQNFEELFLVC